MSVLVMLFLLACIWGAAQVNAPVAVAFLAVLFWRGGLKRPRPIAR